MNIEHFKTCLIDGYLDEPSCLGVPPYIAPHVRYMWGALLSAGISEDNLIYKTIDQLRANREQNILELEEYDLVIVIAGTTVPGNYLGGQPISLTEIKKLGQQLYYPGKVLGGPVTLIKSDMEGYDHICGEIAALDLYQHLTGKNTVSEQEIPSLIGDWAVRGAGITKLHPNYPRLVCEIETFRGCPRSQHCTFCSERLKTKKYQRTPDQIISEVKALAAAGNHYYRLGCQTDLMLYQAHQQQQDFIPNPEAIDQLYRGIRKADPQLEVLHLDNMNPASIVKHEQQSRQILNTITTYNTPGDVAAFGLESADPRVLEKNNIESDPESTYKAVNIINEIGGGRKEGLPLLLPGINFLHGLIGETEETLEHNYHFLKKILDNNLMLRRINIRQVATLDSYPQIEINHNQFLKYKDKINKEINKPMLQRVFPAGTIINNVLTETHRGKLTYGRQLGSYPILIGIPGQLDLNEFITVRVIDHGYRSLTALPWPFNYKEAVPEQLSSIPGIGNKRARKIFLQQPETKTEFKQILGDNFPLEKWADIFQLNNEHLNKNDGKT